MTDKISAEAMDDAVTLFLAATVQEGKTAREGLEAAFEIMLAAYKAAEQKAAPSGEWRWVPVEPTPEMVAAAMDRGAPFGVGALYKAMLAAAPQKAMPLDATGSACDLGDGLLGCYDCGVPYGSARFQDFVIPNDVWAKISPTGGEGGLLCANCICERLAISGIETTGRFTSGPLAQKAMPDAEGLIKQAHVLSRWLCKEALGHVAVTVDLLTDALTAANEREAAWKARFQKVSENARKKLKLADMDTLLNGGSVVAENLSSILAAWDEADERAEKAERERDEAQAEAMANEDAGRTVMAGVFDLQEQLATSRQEARKEALEEALAQKGVD